MEKIFKVQFTEVRTITTCYEAEIKALSLLDAKLKWDDRDTEVYDDPSTKELWSDLDSDICDVEIKEKLVKEEPRNDN